MNYDINTYIEKLNNKRNEIAFIERKIKNRKKIFEKIIRPLVDTLQRRKKELYDLYQIEVSVRLGDLLSELALLAEIKVSDIYVEIETGISFYGKYNIIEMLQLMNDPTVKNCKSNTNEMKLDLFGCSSDYNVTLKPVFEYYTSLPLYLEEIQSDGRKIIQYCNVKYGYDTDGGVYTKMVINNDVENIICNFNLGYLNKVSDEDWNPADLFNQAIINCASRNYNSSKQYVRVRTRNNDK